MRRPTLTSAMALYALGLATAVGYVVLVSLAAITATL